MGRRYAWFIAPAVVVTVAVIIFPWMFTVFMSMHDWQVTGARTFIGFDNYVNAFRDARFLQAIGRTATYALFAVSMMALSDAALAKKLSDFRARQTEAARAMTLPPAH